MITRRGFFRAGAGAAATALLAAVENVMLPSQALAIAGVDDAVVGGALLVLMTLAGYAVSSEVSQATLSAMGYTFSDFAQDASNQSAAVGRAIADANNLGVEVNRMQAESAAAAIAAGTGTVGDWFADMASTGRMTLDGFVNGVGAVPAALWGMVAEFAENVLGYNQTLSADADFLGIPASEFGSHTVGFGPVSQVMAYYSFQVPEEPYWAIYSTGSIPYLVLGMTQDIPAMSTNGSVWELQPAGQVVYYYDVYGQNLRGTISSGTLRLTGDLIASDMLVTGQLLPGVDRAPDAPETYGAGYDKTILGQDMVVDGNGDVVSAGTITLPVQYPHVELPYVDGLYGIGAGVVPGILDVPIAGSTPVVVGTQTGVVSMPITQAVATDTSVAVPATPTVPVVPPGTPDVGPWQPAYQMPFYEVWPFNLVYTFVEQISALGGS